MTTRPGRQPLGLRGAHVVLAEHLEHHRARHAHDRRAQVGTQQRRRQGELRQVTEGIDGERDDLNVGAPAEVERGQHDRERAEPERRQRQERHRGAAQARVEGRVAPRGRDDARDPAIGHAEPDGEQRQLERHRHPLRQQARHGPLRPQRPPEVSAREPADPPDVLLEERLVQPEPRPHLGEALGIPEIGEHQRHHVPGTNRMTAKTITLTRTSVGTINPTRRARKVPTTGRPPSRGRAEGGERGSFDPRPTMLTG